MNWLQLAQEVVEGKVISNQEASSILHCDDDDLLLLMHGAFHIRKHYFGKKVKLNPRKTMSAAIFAIVSKFGRYF